MKVELCNSEYLHAAFAGFYRQVVDVCNGKHNAHGLKEQGFDQHIIGALGELGVAKALNVYWPGPGKFGGHDVGIYEVRTVDSPSKRLTLHKSDEDNDIFISAVFTGRQILVRGWLRAVDGKIEKFWEDPTGTGRPAFFVPNSLLNPMEKLPLG